VATHTIESLFQLPLSEFTAAINSLAAYLKKAGHSDEAARVKGLSRPPISAWTVNQLYWRHRKAYDRLMRSGEQFRDAQAAHLSGQSADVRRALDARREALAELSKLAAHVLKEASHQPTPDTMRRVTTTLEALSTYSGSPGAPRGGQLLDDVDPPGFETLAALVPSVGDGTPARGRASVIPFHAKAKPGRVRATRDADLSDQDRERQRKAKEAEARAAVQRAERTLRDAQRAAEQAEGALKKAAARLKSAERERADFEARLEKINNEVTEARQDARRITAEAEEAAQAVSDAERQLEKARELP